MAITISDLQAKASAYTDAWNSGTPENVAAHFATDASIVINRGEPSIGRVGIAAMAAGFFADVPDLKLICDKIRPAGDHAVFLWSFTGHYSFNGNRLDVSGWEEWDLTEAMEIGASRGWFDADDYARQLE